MESGDRQPQCLVRVYLKNDPTVICLQVARHGNIVSDIIIIVVVSYY